MCLQVETQVELWPKSWTVYIDSCNLHQMLLCSFWGTLIIANLRCGYLGSNSILNVTLEMVKLLINAMETSRMHIQLELSHRCPILIIMLFSSFPSIVRPWRGANLLSKLLGSGLLTVLETLKGCYLSTDWDIFHESDLNKSTEVITAYINFCVDVVIPQKSIKLYPNSKPYITKDVKDSRGCLQE